MLGQDLDHISYHNCAVLQNPQLLHKDFLPFHRSLILSNSNYHQTPISNSRIQFQLYHPLHSQIQLRTNSKIKTSKMVDTVKPATCCNRSAEGCPCAATSTCSCGKRSALDCNCDKASTENKVTGPRCSCRGRPAGECTCDRAETENAAPTGEKCACGMRSASKFSSLDSAFVAILMMV